MTEDEEAKQGAHENAASQSPSRDAERPVTTSRNSTEPSQTDMKSAPSPTPPSPAARSQHKLVDGDKRDQEIDKKREVEADEQPQPAPRQSSKEAEELSMIDDDSNTTARGKLNPNQTNQIQDERRSPPPPPRSSHRREHNNNNNNSKRHHSSHHQRRDSPSNQRDATGQAGRDAARQGGASGPAVSAEYLAQLIKDKKHLTSFPAGVFLHVPRLIDDEIQKVRNQLFQLNDVVSLRQQPLELPEAEGDLVSLQEKIYVPVEAHPEYNFVGRILGPRGMTAKQLEQETGCKIMIRGKGSMRDKKKEEQNRGKANWEHLNDDLHVLITVEDTENRARLKLERAIEEVRQLLVPIVDGEDELKKRQLMELAIINGTYRDCNYNETLGKMLNDAAVRQNRLTGGSNPIQEQGAASAGLMATGHHHNNQHQQLLAAAAALANGSPPAGNLRHFFSPPQQPGQHHPYQANPNGSVSVTSSGGLPSTGSSTPNSIQASGITSQQMKGHNRAQHHHSPGPAAPSHLQHRQHHLAGGPNQQHNLPMSQHHPHLGHSAAIAATAAAIAAAQQQHHHHHNQQVGAAQGGPRAGQQPPPAPSYLHLAGGHPPPPHQSPAVAAAAAAAAAALMSSGQAGGTAADASALLYAQQYHEFQYAAMAAAASASQQSILQMSEYGAHYPTHHAHHPHHAPPQPPPPPSSHHQAVAAAAAAAAAAQAHHHHQHQEYQRLFAEHQHQQHQQQQHQQQHQQLQQESNNADGDHSMAPHYASLHQEQQHHLAAAEDSDETNGNDRQYTCEAPAEEQPGLLPEDEPVAGQEDQQRQLVMSQQQPVSS